MNGVRNLLVGFELGNRTSQLSYYDNKTGEPVSVPTKLGTNLCRFPTELLKVNGSDEWHFGMEAEYFERKSEGVPVRHLLTKLESGTVTLVDGRQMTPEELLSIFFRESLKLLGLSRPERSIESICVTCERLTPGLALGIRKALVMLGFKEDRCRICDNMESFYYYAYSQRPELHQKNIGLFRFTEQDVTFDTMTEMRGRKPSVVTIDRKGAISLPADHRERDRAFAAAVREWTESIPYSALYLTGKGFGSEWAKESLDALSNASSHVFEGDNLYVKGACWMAAGERMRPGFRDRVYMQDAMVPSTIAIDVIDGGKPGVFPLVKAGESYYLNRTDCQIILEGRDDITVTVYTLDGRSHKNLHMELPGLPDRPAGATRLALTAECTDSRHCRITASDMGFGDLYESSGLKWEKIIDLKEEI